MNSQDKVFKEEEKGRRKQRPQRDDLQKMRQKVEQLENKLKSNNNKNNGPSQSALSLFDKTYNQAEKKNYLTFADKKILYGISGKGKPSYEKIKSDYKGLSHIDYQPPAQSETKSMAQINQLLKQAYKFGVEHKQTPKEIFDKLSDHSSQQYKMFAKLKQYTGSSIVRQKLKSSAYGKIRKTTAQNLQIPLHDADIILLLDDWYDDLKQYGGKFVDKAKTFVKQNKDHIYPLITGLLTRINPAMGMMSGYALQKFGGKMQSQDPYANDVSYIKYIYGIGPAHPAPRFQSHYMYQMTTRIEALVKTNVDGQATVVINPIAMFQDATYTQNAKTLPFVSVCGGSGFAPFAVPPIYSYSPFASQKDSVMTYALDSLQLDFIETQSPLQVKGKFQTSFFYEPPNATWNRQTSGVYASTAINITDSQLTNNTGYVLRRSCLQTTKLTRIGTYINQKNKNECLPVGVLDDTDNIVVNTTSFIILKFTGCTPQTNIGTLWLTVAASIEPIASMRGILKVSPRGSYEGFFRATKQARKQGVPLQFLDCEAASFLYKDSFAQMDFNNNVSFGCGYDDVEDPLFRLVFDPQSNGYCLNQCLKYCGLSAPSTPWMSIAQIQNLLVNYVVYKDKTMVSMVRKNESDIFIRLNLNTHHASVVKLNNSIVGWDWMGVISNNSSTYVVNQASSYINFKYGLGQQTAKVNFPIAINLMQYRNLQKLMQEGILVGQSLNIQKPNVRFDLQSFPDTPIVSTCGILTKTSDSLILTNGVNQVSFYKPLAWQVQRDCQIMIDQDGLLLDSSTIASTLISLVNHGQQLNGMNQNQLQEVKRQNQYLKQVNSKPAIRAQLSMSILATTFQVHPDLKGNGSLEYLQLIENNDPFVNMQQAIQLLQFHSTAQLHAFIGATKPVFPQKLLAKLLNIGQQLWNQQYLTFYQAQHYVLHEPRISKSLQIVIFINILRIKQLVQKRVLNLSQIKTQLLRGCVETQPGPDCVEQPVESA